MDNIIIHSLKEKDDWLFVNIIKQKTAPVYTKMVTRSRNKKKKRNLSQN